MTTKSPSIPYLFVDHQMTLSTKQWYDHINNNKSSYTNCHVKRITHIKNLYSNVAHEYLAVIIEDSATATRARIIAERQTNQDQVIIGRWGDSAKPKPGRKDDDLPLPLYTETFPNSYPVSDLAGLLLHVSNLVPKYDTFTANCYWFCLNIYLDAQTSRAGRETAFAHADVRGQLIAPEWMSARYKASSICFVLHGFSILIQISKQPAEGFEAFMNTSMP